MALETLFLDAGGVLMNPNWERVADALGRQSVEVSAAALAAAEPWAKHDLDTPEQVRRNDDASRGRLFFDLVLRRAGVQAPPGPVDAAWDEVQAYHRQHNLWEKVPEEVVPALARLRRAGLRLVVVSNANGTLRAQLARLGLAGRVDHSLDSFEEGVEKPDPRLFRIALERAQAQPETTLHVGDLYEIDVVGARSAGLAAVLLDAAGLYADRDCPRVASLSELAGAIEAGRF
jgi:HAD superfamily hydrolase (TIGR01549 family)